MKNEYLSKKLTLLIKIFKVINEFFSYIVRLGEFHVETKTDCVGSGNLYECTDYKDYEIEEIDLHPFYDGSNGHIVHDIALIRVNKSVPYNGMQIIIIIKLFFLN